MAPASVAARGAPPGPHPIDAVAASAVRSAARALSEMAMREIVAHSPHVRTVGLSHLSMVAGDPERAVVAVYLGIQGDVPGHILLAFSEPMARGLVDMLLDQPEGTTVELGEMEISALAEAGNVAGSFFLTTLAEWAGLTLPPTPPMVIHEMCGAILDTLAAELAVQAHDEAMVIDAHFTCDDQVVDASFFMFPGHDILQAGAEREAAENTPADGEPATVGAAGAGAW